MFDCFCESAGWGQNGGVRQIEIGTTGVEAGVLSYGCMRIAGTWDPNDVTAEREAAGRKALLAAWEAGYTLFDHADIYARGACEALHGRLMADTPGMRDEILLATKCGIRFPGDPHAGSPHRYDFSKGHILWSCEQSLSRLKTDRIDLYQLHRPDVLMDPDEVGEAFERLHEQGKVRWFGVSNFSPSFVSTLQSGLSMGLQVNQVEISLARLDCFTDGTLDQCLRDSLTPLAWSPVGGGWLAASTEPDEEERFALWTAVGEVADKYDLGRGEVCYAFLLTHPSGIVPIVGTVSPERIRGAVKATEVVLDREDWYRLYVAARGEGLP